MKIILSAIALVVLSACLPGAAEEPIEGEKMETGDGLGLTAGHMKTLSGASSGERTTGIPQESTIQNESFRSPTQTRQAGSGNPLDPQPTSPQECDIITTVAGTGMEGFSGDEGPATEAALSHPFAVVSFGGALYIADAGNKRIRKVETKVDAQGIAQEIITTVPSDTLNYPEDMIIDSAGNIYVAQNPMDKVRKIETNGKTTIVAGSASSGHSGDGGPATQAALSKPEGLAMDSEGNLYIANSGSDRIRKVDANGIITTFAGTGTEGFSGDGGAATQAKLWAPHRIAFDAAGNLYIADQSNHRIRRIDTNGVITTVAGTGVKGFSGDDGPALQAKLYNPYAIALDAAGNIYVSVVGDEGSIPDNNHRIRRIGTNGIITTIAGTGMEGFSGDGGPAIQAKLNHPLGITVDAEGTLYIADTLNHRVRKLTPCPPEEGEFDKPHFYDQEEGRVHPALPPQRKASSKIKGEIAPIHKSGASSRDVK